MPRIAPWLAGWRPYALLGVLCLALYIPGMTSIPLLDRDEARFAQATRQMLETGDFLHIRFQNESRNQKPAGIYWLQAAAVRAFSTPQSTAIWPYRLPSLLGASLAAMLTFGFGRALLRDGGGSEETAPLTAMIAAVFLATALGTMAEAHIAKTDASLLAAIVAGQGALGVAYVRGHVGKPVGISIAAAFWVAQIAAILLKGPIGPMLAIITAATLWFTDRDVRWLRGLRPIAGLALVVLVVAPWLYSIERATEGQFLSDSLGHDFFSKLMGVQESHGAPPFYYLALAMVTFWPASLYLAPALIQGWRHHERSVERFLLAWIIPAWVCLELIPTKLPHYVLPLYPALALLAAAALVASSDAGEAAWLRWVRRGVDALWVAVTLVIAGGMIVLPTRFGDGVSLAGLIGAIVLVGLMAALLLRRFRPSATVGLIVALSLTLVLPMTLWIMPGLDKLWLSREAAAAIERNAPDAGKPVILLGYDEPSLVFLLGGNVEISTMPRAAVALAGGGEALVTGREDAQFQQGLAARGLAAQPLDAIRGTDYSNGQRMVLTLYRVVPQGK
jgi:4-amino-4-deoxy-L-arabinose transferase-like glycosyltransferase